MNKDIIMYMYIYRTQGGAQGEVHMSSMVTGGGWNNGVGVWIK